MKTPLGKSEKKKLAKQKRDGRRPYHGRIPQELKERQMAGVMSTYLKVRYFERGAHAALAKAIHSMSQLRIHFEYGEYLDEASQCHRSDALETLPMFLHAEEMKWPTLYEKYIVKEKEALQRWYKDGRIRSEPYPYTPWLHDIRSATESLKMDPADAILEIALFVKWKNSSTKQPEISQIVEKAWCIRLAERLQKDKEILGDIFYNHDKYLTAYRIAFGRLEKEWFECLYRQLNGDVFGKLSEEGSRRYEAESRKGLKKLPEWEGRIEYTMGLSDDKSQYITMEALQSSLLFRLQRRFASEEAQTQSEPVADRETEAQHGDNSIAAVSPEQSQPEPSTEHTSTQDPYEQSQQQEQSTLGELASAAADKAKETASSAYSAVTGDQGGTAFGERRPQPTPQPNVYVGNLFFDVKSEDLRKEFEKCGPIESVKLIMDNRGLSKGFGYVNFTSTESATKAIRDFNMKDFAGRRLSVQYASPRPPPGSAQQPFNRAGNNNTKFGHANAPTRTLFIGNMAFDMSDRELNQLFREIRNVVDVRVAIDRRTGQPRGFAHADFLDVESAKAAMLALANKEVCGRALRVDYSQSTGRTNQGAAPQEGAGQPGAQN
ncbi:MAG: hypothetical protein Q9218_007915 [Villophora microphyllina]